MQIFFIWLGTMGLNVVTRLVRGGHTVVAYHPAAGAASRAETAGTWGPAEADRLIAAGGRRWRAL